METVASFMPIMMLAIIGFGVIGGIFSFIGRGGI